MASVSFVGQHPGSHSEPILRVFRATGSRKKAPLPRMVLRRGDPDVPLTAAPAPCGASVTPASSSRRLDHSCDQHSTTPEQGGTGGRRQTSLSGGHRRHRNGLLLGHPSVLSGEVREQSLGPPLERVTQARSGVVRLARSEPHRREAWSIFPRGVDPRVRTETGEGHRFEAKPVSQEWCDVCGRQIKTQALECQNCSYTCHLECESHIQLDCNQRHRKPEETPSPRRPFSSARCTRNESKEEEEGGASDLSEEEVRCRIEQYNSQVSENGMNLASDGSYTGFIKVHLRLSRPVTVPAVDSGDTEGVAKQNQAPPDAAGEAEGDRRTSFYLPCDCVKQLHISSLTTTREVIQGLLKKFMVLDNPRKFALYRQTHRDGQDLFQKLPLCERPLLLRLIAGPDPEQLSFVLKENETGEVEWHAFSVPELQNFLVILEKEEAERVRAVEQKYSAYRRKLQQALQQLDP
ncbi:ras association domain-containing protein 5 [Synchiropus splendidus]|uniref:ras association domain-containing protein 5 n=1 Tax=Synchiropus splendidus TaxID=270530 RepID=UPI00237D87E4|nr:ras association domain-containing protein 5 [Synchiropus splendidus]